MRLAPASLFGRMFASSLLATLAALVIAGFAISGVLERFVTDGIDMRLRDRLVALESAIDAKGAINPIQLARVTARIRPDEPWRIELAREAAGSHGEIAFRDDPHKRPPAPLRPDDVARQADPADDTGVPFEGHLRDGRRVHGLFATMTTAAGEARLIVVVPRTEIDRPVLAAWMPLALSLSILGLALGAAALLQLRWGLRPLQRLSVAVEAIRAGRPSQIPQNMPSELVPLARELDALAADTKATLAAARTSAANLAHALKTPVATLSLHLADDPAAQTQLARIDATLRHHLGRARATATDRRAATPLAPALADLCDTIAALHHGRVSIRLDVPDGLIAAIGAQDLDELAGNLLDNSARHAVETVCVTAGAEGRRIWLTVTDDGPGIAAEDRVRATAPGIRLDERGDGHGFGLAIARELAELYGGSLALEDAPSGGLTARLTLPSAR